MKSFTEQQKQWIVEDFTRRRKVERLIVLPGLASVFLLAYLYVDPRHEIAGLGGVGPAAAAAAIVVAAFVLHLRNWRCPACKSQLAGRLVHFCRRCGAVFIPDQEARSKRSPLERDVQIELGEYRYSNRKGLFTGILLVLFGSLLGFLTATGKVEPLTPAWARQSYGPLGTAIAGVTEALAGLVVGAWALANARRGMTVGIRAREKFLRQRIASPPTAAGPAAAAPPEAQAATPAQPVAAGRRKSPGGEKKQAARTLTPVELWAVAVSANLTITWEHDFAALALPNGPEKAKEVLGRQWSLHGREDAEQTFNWLRHEGHSAEFEQMLSVLAQIPASRLEAFIADQDPEFRRAVRFVAEHGAEVKNGNLAAWDTVRLSFLARATFTAGWLDEAAAWKVALEAARKLQRSYGSWDELSENFLLGRGFWGEASPESMEDFRQKADWLLTSKRSPWTQLPWDLPLATVHLS